MSGASLARRRIDENYRRTHSTATFWARWSRLLPSLAAHLFRSRTAAVRYRAGIEPRPCPITEGRSRSVTCVHFAGASTTWAREVASGPSWSSMPLRRWSKLPSRCASSRSRGWRAWPHHVNERAAPRYSGPAAPRPGAVGRVCVCMGGRHAPPQDVRSKGCHM